MKRGTSYFGVIDVHHVEDVHTATRCAVEGGVDSVFMWGYDVCRAISSNASEDPDQVWETYLTALSEASR